MERDATEAGHDEEEQGAAATGAADATPARPRRKLPPRRPDQLPRGRHGLSPAEVAASQRGRILDAMKSAAGDLGYHDASVAEVIKRAGVTRKAFYKLFDDKEQCFIQAYERDLARLLTLTLEAFETQDAWADRLRAALSALLHALGRDPAAARLCFIEVMTAGPRAIAARNEAMRGFTLIFDAGRLEDDRARPPALALNMVGGMSEIVHREIAAGRAEDLPRVLPDLMYTAVLPILGPDAAERELERGGPER
ncbi:MAG: TetR/AcrR family transcriptional regulator [Solirubrobacterales bacterium]|nr:TetR/AcrR family transcriptional regulator [Solirubrobacterales bacterium]